MQGSTKPADDRIDPMNIVTGSRNARTSALQPNSSYLLNEGVKPSATVWLTDTLMLGSAHSASVQTYSTNLVIGIGNDKTLER